MPPRVAPSSLRRRQVCRTAHLATPPFILRSAQNPSIFLTTEKSAGGVQGGAAKNGKEMEGFACRRDILRKGVFIERHLIIQRPFLRLCGGPRLHRRAHGGLHVRSPHARTSHRPLTFVRVACSVLACVRYCVLFTAFLPPR